MDDGTLNALLDGELPAEEARAVEEHLAACAECRGRFEEARAFLMEAGELLNLLETPSAQAGAPPSPRRVSQTLKEAAVDPGAAPRVSRTAKEPAVDPDAPRKVAATSKEHAVNIDAGTQKSPAVRLFPQAGERTAGPTPPTAQSPALPEVVPLKPRRGWDTERWAWAASIVLALGVGYLVNEVRRTGAMNDQLAAQLERTTAPVEVAVADSTSAVTPAGPTAGAPTRRSARSRLGRTPPDTAKPPTADAMADAALRGAQSGFQQAAEQRRREVASGVGAAGGAGVAGPAGQAPADSAGRALASRPTQPVQRPAEVAQAPSRDAASRQGAAERQQPPAAAAAPPPPTAAAPGLRYAARPDRRADSVNRLDEVTVTGILEEPGRARAPMPRAFRRLSFDTAITRLSGSIRLIDGMEPLSVEEGPGHLVPGADPMRSVIRVIYRDAAARRLILDQQPGDARPGPTGAMSVNGLMRGDTLMTGGEGGSLRIRWVDRKGFWLSLTASGVPGEELRALVERIR